MPTTTMAERFVKLYRQWQQMTDSTESLSDWLHAQNHIGSGEDQITFLQGWNVRHVGETGTNRDKLFEHDARRYAVMDFDVGSYAFSPLDPDHLQRRWLYGKPE